MARSNDDLSQRDTAAIAEIQKLRFNPLAARGGKGSYLTNEDGRRILDLSASATAASLGYAHPAVTEAVTKALTDMAGASLLMYPNEPAAALAEALLQVTPGSGERRVWFGHSGSDANDAAARVLEAATGRPRFISFIGSYHGGVAGSMAISGHTAMTHTLPRPGLVLLPYPDPYRPRFSADEVLDMLDYQFETTCPPEQVAAVFIEPVMSDGGLIVPPAGFLKALEERCRQHGILTVLDEVKVGCGRSGLFHAFSHEGLTPDLVVLGKGIGGGLATLRRDRPRGHSGPPPGIRHSDHRRQPGLHRRGPRRAAYRSRRGSSGPRRAHGQAAGGRLARARRASHDDRRRAGARPRDRRRPGA